MKRTTGLWLALGVAASAHAQLEPGYGMRYPVPWAESADTSCLETHANTIVVATRQ